MLAMALAGAVTVTSCTRDVQAMDPQLIEQQYGVTGAFTDTVATTDGPLKGTLVPVTLANGRQGHLFIPERQASDLQTVYIRDKQGLHPVELQDNVTRDEVARAPAIVEARPATQPAASTGPAARTTSKRSWEKEVLIIGGSAGAGAAIGAIAGGKKGAGIGAAAGGVGGLIYDLATRNKTKEK